MSAGLGLDEYEVSRKPGLSLEGWLAWRGKEGSRPAQRKGDTAGTTGKFEAELWRSTMERIYGEDWRAELDAKELAELAASSDDGDEDEEEEELMPEAPMPGAAPKAFPQAAAVQRSSSPAASRMSSSVGDEGDVVARLKARLETPFVPQLEDLESYSSRVQRIGEALSQLNSPVPEGEMEKTLFRAEVTGELEGASDPLRHLKAAVSSAPSKPACPVSLELRGGGGSGSGDPLADLLTKQTELLKLALEKKPPKRSTIQVTPKVQWPVLDDDCSDFRSVQEFYDQFEATIALANDGSTYELIYKRHLNDGLLKRDPGAVYSAVKQKHLLFAETREEKELRVLDDWERLHKGRLSAHQWEVLWEEKLGEREAVGLGMTARENLIQYLRKIGDQLSREVRKDKRYREGATGAREFRGVATWEEAHEVVKEYEAMNAGQRALQNSSLSVGGPQDASSPGDSADKRKKKKKKGEGEADSSMPLDANAKKKKKVCLLMRDHGSCKHGDRCEYSHEKSLVEAERKKKKEADKAKGNDSAAASSSKGKGKKDKDKDKDKKGKGKGDRKEACKFWLTVRGCDKGDACPHKHDKGAKQRFLAEIAKAKGTGVPGVQLATTDGPSGVGASAMACENPFVCFESAPLEGGLQWSVPAPAAADSIARAQPSPAPKEKNKKKEKAKAGSDVAKEDFNGIDDLPKSWFVDTPNSRGGYQYKTEVEIFGRKVACMLDTCAGCNSVTEEMVVGMIRVALKAGVRPSSTEFPVAALERWEVPEVVNGLAKDSPLPLKGGWLILGGRALDSADRGGLGFHPGATAHVLEGVDIHLPHMEETESFTDKAYPYVAQMVTHYDQVWSACPEERKESASEEPGPKGLGLIASQSLSVHAGDVGTWAEAAPGLWPLGSEKGFVFLEAAKEHGFEVEAGMPVAMVSPRVAVQTACSVCGAVTAEAWTYPELCPHGKALRERSGQAGEGGMPAMRGGHWCSEFAPGAPARRGSPRFRSALDDDFVAYSGRSLPTDEYYSLLRADMGARHPKVDPHLLDHLETLEAFLDTSIMAGVSFGIEKAKIAVIEGELLGHVVGRRGAPVQKEKTHAIVRFPPLKEKVQVQQFLGCTNFLRYYLQPQYAHCAKILGEYVKGKEFPEAGLGPGESLGDLAVRAIKLMAKRTIELSVVDEIAAICGQRPLEQIADSSGYAVGGVAVQMREDLCGFNVLCTHSKGLTPPQQAWAPLSLETYAQLEVRRAVKGMLGPLRCIMWTDHSNLTRLQTSEEIQPKHLRWLSELLADGSTLRSLSGRSARLADGLSRNPPERDELLQQRTKDLQGLIGQLRGFSLEEFLGEEVGESDPLVSAERASGVLGSFRPGAVPVLKVLYVPDYCTEGEISLEEPPFEDIDGTGLHFERQGKARLTGRKLANAVRVDLFTSVAKLLRELATHRPAVVVGRDESRAVAAAWGAVKLAVVEVPRLSRAKPGWTVLKEGCPEFKLESPIEPWPVEAVLPKGTPNVVELKSACEELKVSVAEKMGTTAWGPWLERETKEAWEHSGVCACGRRTALFGQCMKCSAEDLSEDRASITPEAGFVPGVEVLAGGSSETPRVELCRGELQAWLLSGDRKNLLKGMVLVEVRWKRGERLLVDKPDGWRNRTGVTVYTLDGKLPLELCHVVSPKWPLDLTQQWRRKPGDQFWVQRWTVVEKTLHEIAQYARDRGGLDEAGRDCKEALESFFAFAGHYARGLVVVWEQLPERFRKGAESNVLWFEERPEGGWTWKFEKVGPGHQPRIEGRIYLVLGAETRDRERLLLVPGSPPIPYSFHKAGDAPRGSRGFPSESSEAEDKAARVPERWLESAFEHREGLQVPFQRNCHRPCSLQISRSDPRLRGRRGKKKLYHGEELAPFMGVSPTNVMKQNSEQLLRFLVKPLARPEALRERAANFLLGEVGSHLEVCSVLQFAPGLLSRPGWEPVSEYAARLFRRYRELRVKVLNHRASESAKRASLLNRFRVSKQLAVGDVVVLRDPRTTRAGGRTPWRKQLTGPYTVVQISPSGNKLELKDEATGKIQEANVENVVLLPPGYKSWEATGDSEKPESRPMRFREQEEIPAAEVVEPGAVSAQETLSVQRVIMKVELLKHGVLNHAAARRLDSAGYKFARQSVEQQALSLSLKEMQQEEWWKEVLQPSAILLGESDSKEVNLTDPKGVVSEFEIPGKALTTAELEQLAKEATVKWSKAGKAKSWDEIRAPLEVYRFGGVQLTEHPRRTEEYGAKVVDGCDLKHLKVEEAAAVREVLSRKAGAFWLPGSPRTTILHMQHDIVPSRSPVKTPPHS
ncbi:pol [Symbiodinium necroappetens]|uniref:Pol protein n=1 Tax=Symbiodinium necroappetens TaxID=1628268 RepID=A0A812KDV3_9DINO|nr:pol [Symbiodinium necroappetens]